MQPSLSLVLENMVIFFCDGVQIVGPFSIDISRDSTQQFEVSPSSEQKSPMSEQFVKLPGIIELRWTSDDPEYSNPTTDLYDEQARGIPEWWVNEDHNFSPINLSFHVPC